MSSYLQILKANHPRVQGAQRLNYVMFNPALCKGIAHCYYSVWGDTFPATFMYEPELIREYYTEKGQIGAFAVTQYNEVVGMFCAYPFHASSKVYELGGLMVIPEYRGNVDLKRLIEMVQRELEHLKLDISLIQIVSHYKAAQKVLHREISSNVSGIELSAFSYQKNKEMFRTAYLDMVQVHNSQERKNYVPEYYREQVSKNVRSLKIQRDIRVLNEAGPLDKSTDLKTFSYERVLKIQVIKAGADWLQMIKHHESKPEFEVIQIAVPIEYKWGPGLIEDLNQRGYFYSSHIPFFNGKDCIILQKIKNLDPFENLMMHSENAKNMLEFIKQDYQRISLKNQADDSMNQPQTN